MIINNLIGSFSRSFRFQALAKLTRAAAETRTCDETAEAALWRVRGTGAESEHESMYVRSPASGFASGH